MRAEDAVSLELDRLTVRATGKVLGKIRYGQLEIERGGIISGTIEALPETAQAAGISNS